jgi:predicted RNase H-like HicB family nuclease
MSRATRNARRVVVLDADGWIAPPPGTMYRYHIYVNESDGRFLATAAAVPGVTATGGSADEALATIRTTILSLLRQSKASGEPMPHGEVAPPAGAVMRGVFIDLNAA